MAIKQIPTHPLQELDPMQFGIERISHVNRYNPAHFHRHDYFEIFLFSEGGGKHQIDFTDIPIESNSIHFVTPGQVHQLDRATNSSGFVLLFSTDFFGVTPDSHDFLFHYPLFYSKRGSPVLVLPPDEFEHILTYVESMLREFDGQHSQKKRILQSYLHIFLYRCQHWLEEHEGNGLDKSPAADLFQAFQTQVELHYHDRHQVVDYTTLLFVTPRQLNATTQKFVGKSAMDMIQDRIALESKRLLIYSGRTVSDIAYDLGFDDLAHFSRFVKRETGRSPSEWKLPKT